MHDFTPARTESICRRTHGRVEGSISFHQFIPNKPTQFGFKLWVLAESNSGYTWNFEVYTGRAANNQPEVGLAHNGVMRLTEPLLDQGYAMFWIRNVLRQLLLYDQASTSSEGQPDMLLWNNRLQSPSTAAEKCESVGQSGPAWSYAVRQEWQLGVYSVV